MEIVLPFRFGGGFGEGPSMQRADASEEHQLT
jgi:hypothetical protein